MRRLAQQLYLVGLACETFDRHEPQDAFVLIESGKTDSAGRDDTERLFRATVDMYRGWARKRRMRQQPLDGQEPGATRVALAVTGFAAYPILAPETGLHVWEIPRTGRDFTRYQVRVRVAPQPDTPLDAKPSLLAHAERALAALDEAKLQVVRRYREQPSPLVRDSIRGWRTGRLDRVLDGDFDVIG